MTARGALLAKLGVATAAWLALVECAPGWLRAHAPMAVQRAVSEAGYLAAIELFDVAVGAGLLVLLVRSEAKRVLAWTAPTLRALASGALLVPLLSAASSAIALTIAMPWLLDEVAHRGAHVSRENAGELGRVLSAEPLVATILFGAVLAAFGEELLFRGALFGWLKECLAKPPPPPSDDDVPSALAPHRLQALREWVFPTVGTAIVFALLHADMHGAVGIVRVISTTILALACGAARHFGRSIVVPIVMHLFYNLIAIAQVRGLVAAISPATWGYVPAPLVVTAISGGLLAAIVMRRRAT